MCYKVYIYKVKRMYKSRETTCCGLAGRVEIQTAFVEKNNIEFFEIEVSEK